jgi:hypothetical protein
MNVNTKNYIEDGHQFRAFLRRLNNLDEDTLWMEYTLLYALKAVYRHPLWQRIRDEQIQRFNEFIETYRLLLEQYLYDMEVWEGWCVGDDRVDNYVELLKEHIQVRDQAALMRLRTLIEKCRYRLLQLQRRRQFTETRLKTK